ncbi:integrase [Methylorubrum extorquens]
MRFTKQAVEALPLPPHGSGKLYWDDALKGFGVKVNAGGSRQWIAQYRSPDGRTPRITIGRVDTLSLEEARKQARLILAKAQTGSDPQAEKAEARRQASVTLGSVTDIYLNQARNRLKQRSFAEVERSLRNQWKPLAALPISSIRRADVASHLNTLAERGRVGATRARAYLSALFSWAIGEGIVEANPVTGTNKPAEEESRDRVLTEAELAAIWKACGNDDYGVMVKLLLLTAQRRDEVGGMADGEVDLAAALWTIPGERTKNGRPQEVPLSSSALDLIVQKPRLAGRTLMFGRGSGSFSGWSQSKRRLDGRIADGEVHVAPWRLHDLRRTAATTMAERLRVSPHVIEAILNHVSGHRAGVAGVYNRASYRDEKRSALDAWAAEVARICG